MTYLKRLIGCAFCCGVAAGVNAQSDSLTVMADSVAAPVAAEVPAADTVRQVLAQVNDEEARSIDYSSEPKEYVIKDIEVSGNGVYDKQVLIAYSGLKVGERVKMPGEAFSGAIKKFWKQGLFSDVKIYATKIQGEELSLELAFQPRPRISDVVIEGVKSKDKEDIQSGIGLSKGVQISPAMITRAQFLIKRKLAEKGYEKAEVAIELKPDPTQANYQIVYIDIDHNKRVKVHRIHLQGNDNLSDFKSKWAMKDTKEPRIYNIFKSKRFVRTKYADDKGKLLAKFNEKGFRDAEIVADSVVPYNSKKVDVYITIKEGKRYYIRNINWTGNTIYTSEALSAALGIKKGDVYNQKLLNERINTDEDAVSNLYMDNGYLFFNVEPVELNVDGDSIDMEMRIYEGRQAVINKVEINGNTAVYDNVIRRELRTKPGDLFSKSNLQRSARELASTGQFDPEKLDIRPVPHPEDGTVDIIYNLEQKRNDQVELSFGYGSSGVTGSLGFKFTNFSARNIFNAKSYRPLPQGDGQTLSINYTTNGDYYNSAAISFVEPWLGGRRPTNFSTTFYWSKQTGLNSAYEDRMAYSYFTSSANQYNYDADPEKYIITMGGAVGVGTRLTWPDDYFTLYGEIAYRHYKLKNWGYFDLSDGVANNLNVGVTFARNSTDNPYFTHRGSNLSIGLRATPPYSLFKDNDRTYSLYNRYRGGDVLNEDEYNEMQTELYKWVEYYKTELKAKLFTPLTSDQKLVLMTRAEYGFLGYYNINRRSPFERYYVGGDGTTGTSSTYATTSVAMRGYSNGSLTPRDPVNRRQAGNMYTRLSLELRYPLMMQPASTIYVLTFADAGNAWMNFGDFNPFDLKRSVGVGARIFLPMLGLIGVDYGYGFDTPHSGSKGDAGSQFHLVIGQEF